MLEQHWTKAGMYCLREIVSSWHLWVSLVTTPVSLLRLFPKMLVSHKLSAKPPWWHKLSHYIHIVISLTQDLKPIHRSFTASFLCTYLDGRNLKTHYTPQVYQEGFTDTVNQCMDFSGANMSLHSLRIRSMSIWGKDFCVEKLFSFCCSFACLNKGTEFPH